MDWERFFSPRLVRQFFFNGKAFKKANVISGNHFEAESGEEYWISGIRKNGALSHWAGSGTFQIDESMLSDYFALIGRAILPTKYKIIQLNNTPSINAVSEIENRKLE